MKESVKEFLLGFLIIVFSLSLIGGVVTMIISFIVKDSSFWCTTSMVCFGLMYFTLQVITGPHFKEEGEECECQSNS